MNSLSGQPSVDFPVGYESFDASPGTCPYFWPCDFYRNSDANFNVVTGRPVKVGSVAAPVVRQYRFPSDPNRLVIQNGYLSVVDVANSIVSGSVIDKIGSTTGWIYGVVKETCVD